MAKTIEHTPPTAGTGTKHFKGKHSTVYNILFKNGETATRKSNRSNYVEARAVFKDGTLHNISYSSKPSGMTAAAVKADAIAKAWKADDHTWTAEVVSIDWAESQNVPPRGSASKQLNPQGKVIYIAHFSNGYVLHVTSPKEVINHVSCCFQTNNSLPSADVWSADPIPMESDEIVAAFKARHDQQMEDNGKANDYALGDPKKWYLNPDDYYAEYLPVTDLIE